MKEKIRTILQNIKTNPNLNVCGVDSLRCSFVYSQHIWSCISDVYNIIWESEDLPDLDSNLRGCHGIFANSNGRKLREFFCRSPCCFQLCWIYIVWGYKIFYPASNISFIETVKKLSSINEKWPPERIFNYQIGYLVFLGIGAAMSSIGLSLSQYTIVISYIHIAWLRRFNGVRDL